MDTLGVAIAILAALLNGTWVAVAKLNTPAAKPVAFSFWVSVGVAASTSSLLLFPGVETFFTPWGIASGCIFNLASGALFYALPATSLAISSMIWGACAIFSTTIWSIRVENEAIHGQGRSQAALGVLLMVVSLFGCVINGRYSAFLNMQQAEAMELAEDSDDEALVLELVQERRLSDDRIIDPMSAEDIERIPQFGSGLLAAVAAGILAGLVLAPESFVRPRDRGLPFLPSMGAGVLLSAPGLAWLRNYWAGAHRYQIFRVSMSWRLVLMGIATGVVWTSGLICSLAAIDRSATSVYPVYVYHSGFMVAGTYAIVVFREMALRAIPAHLFSGIGLVAGIFCVVKSY